MRLKTSMQKTTGSQRVRSRLLGVMVFAPWLRVLRKFFRDAWTFEVAGLRRRFRLTERFSITRDCVRWVVC